MPGECGLYGVDQIDIEYKKIRVTEEPEVVVNDKIGRIYFGIKYKEVGKDDYTIGYGSYDVNNVLKWKREEFEIVKGEDMITIEDVKEVQEFKRESNTVKYDIASLDLRQLFKICKVLGLNVVPKKQRSYYLDILEEEGYVKGETLEIPKSTMYDSVKEPEHYKHGLFEVIDEMLIMFGPAKTITFCQLNAWKYRARAPYKGKFEEDMEKADEYLKMAYEIQKIRQNYSYLKGEKHESSFLLKGDPVSRGKKYGGDSK